MLRKVISRVCNYANKDSLHKAGIFFQSPRFSSKADTAESLYNVKRIIKNSKFGYEEGPTSIETTCPVCDKAEKNRVFINKTTGSFICPSCQYLDKWTNVEQFFSEAKNQQQILERKKNKERFIEIKSRKLTLETEMVNSFKHVKHVDNNSLQTFDHLKLSDFSTPPLSDMDIFINDQNQIVLPLKNIYDDTVGYKTINKSLAEITYPDRNAFGFLIKRNQKKESNSAILVLNGVDFLALAVQKNLTQTIICLPHGFNSLPQECLPGLDRYQKVILWLDHSNSEAGWDMARNFSKKLDEKRCFFIRPTENHPAPFKALEQGVDLKGIIAKAEPVLHKSITTFVSLRQDVLSDLQNIDKVQGVKWKRFPTLNKLLKGHRKGELTVLTGSTGCGKTTFMSEYSLDLAVQGVPTLWGSFEIRNTRLATTLLRQLAGHPFDPINNLSDFNYWADEFQKLPIYFMTFHGQQSIKVVMEAIEHAAYVHDIHHVIIDNVQFMMGLSEEVKHVDRFWKQDAIIAAFRTFATKKNCHVTLVIHPRKERDTEDLTTSSIFGSAKATQEADNVMIIQDKRLESIRGKKFLQIAKNRYSGDLGILPLDFDKEGLSYAQKIKTKLKGTPEPTEQY